METKLLGIIVIVVIALSSTAGCTSSTSSNPNSASQAAPNAASPSASASGSATPSATAVPGQKIATSIDAWVPPVWYGEGLLPNPGGNGGGQTAVVQGQPATVAAIVNAADGTHPCGPAFSYYIDHQAAGGYWSIPPGNAPGGCGMGVMPHAELQLFGADTAKLSVGVHIFQISYPGDSTYAAAEYVTEFTVVQSTASPTPTATPFPTPTPVASPTLTPTIIRIG